MSLNSDIAKIAARSAKFVLQKILRRQGGFFPGKIALKFDNNLLTELSQQFDAGTVLVTGTNGKTSVTALIASCMKYEGMQVATNDTGANLASGIATAILDFKPRPRKKRFGVFEIDELWVAKVLPQMNSKFLLLLNLFPDQVDRFGGIHNIQKSLLEALNSSPETVLVYNADDPNCQIIADECENSTIPFGVDEKISHINENVKVKCQMCDFNLNYKVHQYAQLGIYRCPNCGFNRANVKYGANNISLNIDSLNFAINGHAYLSKKAAEYVCYNLVGFIALAKEIGANSNTIEKSIKNQNSENGRMQFFEIDGKQVMINLAKNPVGFNQNINYIVDRYNSTAHPSNTAIAFFANTKEGDGKNPAWIHDVNFHALANLDNVNIYYGGEASQTLVEALSDNNIKSVKVENANDLLNQATYSKNVYIIANYTAMFPLRDELISIQKTC